MEEPPLTLLDLGIERRFQETYHFENAGRGSYSGYLLQFTLKGCGIYEMQKRYELTPGRGFFPGCRRKAAIICRRQVVPRNPLRMAGNSFICTLTVPRRILFLRQSVHCAALFFLLPFQPSRGAVFSPV